MPRARYKQVVDAFALEIRAGKYRPGMRLLTHRQLAQRHGLALATATRVYAELEAMGLVVGETGRGTFVRDTALPPGLGVDQQQVVDGLLDLSFNYPTVAGQADLLRAALSQLASSGDVSALLHYQPHGGRLHEREIVAQHVMRSGLNVAAERLLLVDGAQHGLATTAMALFKPGDVIAVDAITYPGFSVLAHRLGLELAAVPANVEGTDLCALARLCQRRRVRAVYVQPTVHNPMGWVMGLAWRHQLIALAEQHDFLIIEDAPYAFLETQAPPPLARLAPERTIYVSSFSKSVATGLRVGYVVAPAQWVAEIERTIRATTWNTPAVMTAMVCQWVQEGTVARLEQQKREDAAQRQAVVARVFKSMRYQAHPASYCVWLPLLEEGRADRVASALLQQGISVSTAAPFSTAAQVPHAIRLALASVDIQQLEKALCTVREVVEYHAYV